MSKQRLYKAWDRPTEEDEAAELEDVFCPEEAAPTTEAEGAPKGWDAYCLEVWGEPREFHFPSDRKIYRSRSSAQDRVNLINRWGGNAVLMECEPNWIPVEQANKQRRNRARRTRVEKLWTEAQRIADEMEN